MPRALLTGAAGFLGSHLADRLLHEGWQVTGIDSLLTGDERNLEDALSHRSFALEHHDVTDPFALGIEADWILHLASPASPVDYLEFPIETLRVGAVGTLRCLEYARTTGASFLLASTSEAYGDPLVSPQPESYWGNVNPVGPRSVYDEAKRFAEAATSAYHRTYGVDVRIVRIFNTYGPRMRRQDGRAVPTFIDQCLGGRPLSIHGDGSQTRSLCYVEDLIEAIYRVTATDYNQPVNIGNPREVTVLELAEEIKALTGASVPVEFTPRPEDDPQMRCPDISLARRLMSWEPTVSLTEGLTRTIDWARANWR